MTVLYKSEKTLGTFMNKSLFFLLYVSMLFISFSCNRELDSALNKAGDNKSELEAVLEHYKNDPDTLKYGAAKFLIENMPYHYSYTGKSIEAYDSAYLAMSEAPCQFREDVFRKLVGNIDFSDRKLAMDINSVKADFLIRVIDEACTTWRNSSWSREYDTSYFYDYVLPYRLLNEPLSNWRDTADEEYPNLKESAVMSKRGIQLEGENAVSADLHVVETEGASQGKMITLSTENAQVDFLVRTTQPEKKRLFVRYTSTDSLPLIQVIVNGKTSGSIKLVPTEAFTTFVNSRTIFDITLAKGDNKITLKCERGKIGVDYIQLNSVEPINKSVFLGESSKYYYISNKKTQNYLTINTKNDSLPCVACLKPFDKQLLSQQLRIENSGYASWNIMCHDSNSSLCLETEYCSVKPNSPVGLYTSLNGVNQRWIVLSAGDGYYKIMNKDSGMFLEARNIGDADTLCQNPDRGADTQKWKISEGPVRGAESSSTLFHTGSAVSEAFKVFDITNLYEWVGYDGEISPKASSLLVGKTGNCRDEACYSVYLCRKLGIPSAVDFTPHWGNRSLSHSWSVLIKPDGKATPFYMGCAPGDTVHYYHSYKKPKILRHRFRINRQIHSDLKYEKAIPDMFRMADYVDVTDEYYETTNIVRHVPAQFSDRHVAYICVFDNRQWVPVFYGNIKNGKVTFPSMGRGIVYVSAFYENGEIKPFGCPFLLTDKGEVIDIQARENEKTSLTLLRKYPFMGKEDFFNLRMSGGKFQGANNADFSDANTFYKFEGATSGNWYEVAISDTKKYKYLRYIGPATSHCNINEMEFLDEFGEKIIGAIIGTEGEPWGLKENVFDGNILSGFNAISPDGNWVGLKLKSPIRVATLRFIGRNDGNGIEIGDEYELRYWSENRWRSLGRKIASKNELVFDEVPSNGLYVLSDLTKGHEERIFTYENNRQLWW